MIRLLFFYFKLVTQYQFQSLVLHAQCFIFRKKVAILAQRNFFQKEKFEKKIILGYTFPYKKILFAQFFHCHPTILHFMSHYLQSTISSRKISNQRRTKIAIFSTVILKPHYNYLCNFVLYQKCLFGLLHVVSQFIRKYADKGPFCTT